MKFKDLYQINDSWTLVTDLVVVFKNESEAIYNCEELLADYSNAEVLSFLFNRIVLKVVE